MLRRSMQFVHTYPRTSPNLAAITFLSIVAMASFPSTALASQKEKRLWRFQYTRATDSPSNCPTEEYLRTSLAANLDGKDPFDKDAPRSISVTINRVSNEVEARVTVHDENGTSSNEALHAPAWRCDQLAERIVFAVQNIVAPLELPTAQSVNTQDPPQIASPHATNKATTPPKNEPVGSMETTQRKPTNSRTIPKFGLSLVMGPAWWNAPETALSMAIGIDVLWKRATVGIEGHYEYAWALPNLHDSRVERTTVLLIACRLHRWSTRFTMRGCGFGDFGKTNIEVPMDYSPMQYAPVVDIGGRVGAAVWLTSHFGVELRADAAYAITRAQIRMQDNRIWRAAPFTGALRLAFLGVFDIF
jgi:hypothetical protein